MCNTIVPGCKIKSNATVNSISSVTAIHGHEPKAKKKNTEYYFAAHFFNEI